MRYKKFIKSSIRLSRYQDYLFPVFIITLLGCLFSRVHLDLSAFFTLFIIFSANISALAFLFMINDIEDAGDDLLDKAKAHRNPVSSGHITRNKALFVTFFTSVISISLFYFLGSETFWLGLFTLVLGFLYSWKTIRLKNLPILDLASHGLMIGGLLFLASYFSFTTYNGLNINWLAPFIFITAASMYGELFNEIRDYECDQKAGLKHTVAQIGVENGHKLMKALITIAILSLIFSLLSGIFPIWFFIIFLILGIILILFSSKKTSENYHDNNYSKYINPILQSGIISVFIWLVVRIVMG